MRKEDDSRRWVGVLSGGGGAALSQGWGGASGAEDSEVRAVGARRHRRRRAAPWKLDGRPVTAASRPLVGGAPVRCPPSGPDLASRTAAS
jgi:hypothetical protein